MYVPSILVHLKPNYDCLAMHMVRYLYHCYPTGANLFRICWKTESPQYTLRSNFRIQVVWIWYYHLTNVLALRSMKIYKKFRIQIQIQIQIYLISRQKGSLLYIHVCSIHILDQLHKGWILTKCCEFGNLSQHPHGHVIRDAMSSTLRF